jgi:Protein of unknown function (DUF1579)
MEKHGKKSALALQRLAAFAGNWKGTGTFLEGAGPGEGTRLKTDEQYAWLAGGSFLLYDGSLEFGAGKLIAHRVIGYDEADGSYTMHAFDSLGFARAYRGKVAGDIWIFQGEKERATFAFSEGGGVLETFWENSQEGEHWTPLCRTQETKLPRA